MTPLVPLIALAALALPAAAQDAPGSVPRTLTEAERALFAATVRECWNAAILSPEAMQTRVTIAVTLDPDAVPVPDTIRLVSHVGPSPEETYQSARRAILRCGASGFALPHDKFALWRKTEMTFDPAGSVLR